MRTPSLWMIGIGSALGAFLIFWVNQLWFRLKVFRRRRRGLRAEGKAAAILKRHGYRLRAAQYPARMTMLIDGRRVRYSIRPDGIAKRRGRWYLVEVKTGKTATNPLFRETRRQLLEYYHSLPVDGVLLVDADAGSVKNIRFRGKNSQSKISKGALITAFFVGATLALALMRFYD